MVAGGKKREAGPDSAVMQLVKQNRIVLSIDVRGFGETADHGSNEKHCNKEHRVAVLARDIGRPLIGQRVEDILAALDVLVGQPYVNPSEIEAIGVERAGPVVLHAAALDKRIGRVTLKNSIKSWIDDVVARPKIHNLIGHVIPNALEFYDLPDLLEAIKPRKVEHE